MATFETEAVVLKQFDLGESDRLITLYTRERGKLKAVARGARKGKKSRSGLVLPFSYHNFTLYQGKSLAKINHIESIAMNSKLREDLDYMAYASVVSEYVERAGLEDEADQALFSLLALILEKMAQAQKSELLFYLTVFKAKLLLLLGVKPEIENCTICGEKVDLKRSTPLSVEEGGSICKNCFNKNDFKYTLFSLNEMRALYKITFAEFSQLKSAQFSEEIIEKLNQLTEKFFVYHLDLSPKSLSFLYTIRKMNS
ncbi:DNA replication and repair protein RecO [Halanaerobium saccharolyticum]|uniref:DNA repair protein RecO n=1 Tax=Halanaerobium saccharolyticum TaxID=43595 RepID=A0A4R6S5W6_9FIRM|nr:DNA repair protein RecO [Halanaerobium saccharolyticum]TDP94733.1 DNA replication and repair protein RecO [Halanaerobium saccharolyticum]